jgi:SAM-dependent methyltransferase
VAPPTESTTNQLFDRIGHGYSRYRRPDPRISARILRALGSSRTVLNVGAGAGSYEPQDRSVVAVEPSEIMIAQRPSGSAPVVCASAMALPFCDEAFDAALAILTIHHWPDRERGISEMKRAATEKLLILTWEPPDKPFWLTSDYLPHFLESDRLLFPPWFRDRGDTLDIITIPVPHDCSDGFLCAYWRRPEAYLDPGVRDAISTFSRVGNYERALDRLRHDLADGEWYRRYGDLLSEDEMDFGYRLVILSARP